MAEKLQRISVAIDNKTSDVLKTLAKKKNKTVSEIIRSAISIYSEIENSKGIPPEKTKIYADLLSGREHVIVDIELWTAILDELNEKGSESFWKLVEKIGYEHGIQYRIRGLTNLKDILNYMETENWFRVKSNGSGSYTLILSTRNEQKMLKRFLESLFKAQGIKADIVEGFRKLIIINKENNH